MEGKKLKIIITVLVIFILIASGIFARNCLYPKEEISNFELDALFLKIAINEGANASSSIKIINTGKQQDFSLKVTGLEDIVIPEETNFNLAPREDYAIKLNIHSDDKEAGVYLGELEISSDTKQTVPIILEIQTKEVLFDSNVNLYPQGRELIPGEKLNAEIKIFDLAGIGRDSIRLTYSINSFDGRTIASASEDLVVDGKLDYSRSIDLPMNLRLGDYVFVTAVKYKESLGTSSIFFRVVESREESSANSRTDNLIISVIIIFSFFFLIFLGLFFYSMFYRDKLLIELQNQYRRELLKQENLILTRKKQDYCKLKGDEERRQYEKEVEAIKQQRLNALKEIKKQRVDEFKKIKRKYKGNALKTQLNAWKRKGYDTRVLERKYKFPDVLSIKKKVSEWRKKGYDTSVLDRKLK